MGIQTLVAAQSDGWIRSTLQHLRRMLGLRLRLVVVLQATTKEQQREEIDNLVRLAAIKRNGKILNLGLGFGAPLALAVEMAVMPTVAVVLVTVAAEADVAADDADADVAADDDADADVAVACLTSGCNPMTSPTVTAGRAAGLRYSSRLTETVPCRR